MSGPSDWPTTALGRGLPRWAVVAHDGLSAGFVVVPRVGEVTPAGTAAGLWWGPLGSSPQRLAPPPSVAPVLDGAGRRLLLATDVGGVTRVEVMPLAAVADGRPQDAKPVLLAEIPGSAQQVAWQEEFDRAVVLVAEPGTDSAWTTSTTGDPGRRGDPVVGGVALGARQLWSIDLASGKSEPMTPPTIAVWEVAPGLGGALAVIASAELGEGGWYRSFVGSVSGPASVLEKRYSPDWQVQSVAVEPQSGRTAFVEGWSSDRALVAGEIVVIGPDGVVERRIDNLDVDVTEVAWDRRGRLWFAGWRDCGTAWGVLGPGEQVVRAEPSELQQSDMHPSVAVSADGGTVVACRSTPKMPPHVAAWDGGAWHPWVTFETAPTPLADVTEVTWLGAGGAEVHGLILQPPPECRRGELVALIHGGPSYAWHHGWDPGGANCLIAEGFTVLLPNQRGSAGRGQSFARRNHGDPGGGELEDVIAGARWAARAGLVTAPRTAVMGWSYGGYLSALAAVTRPEVWAAVVHSGMANLSSVRHLSIAPPFYDVVLGGPPSDERARALYVERSAVFLAHAGAAPTLILHGEEDRCVPVSQAFELYGALRAVGAEVAMACYPREGHLLAEPSHLDDFWSRTVDWLRRWSPSQVT